MVTDKARVTGYLGADAEKALQRYADGKRLPKSVAIERIIEELLVKGSRVTPEEIVISSDYENKLSVLEVRAERQGDIVVSICEKLDKIDEQIATLESAYCRLRRLSEATSTEYLTDEQVAAHVRIRVDTAREFRHGIRKPRGSNICSLLEDFVVDNGRWKRK